MNLKHLAIAGSLSMGLVMVAGAASAQTRYVNANTLNCRATPATAATAVSRLSRGDRVTVTETRDGWSLLERRPQCWVSSRYLVDSTVQAFAAPRSSAPRSTSPRPRSGSGNSRSYPPRSTPRQNFSSAGCPCSGSRVCIGPRGGRYCITSGGNKRYGV